MDIYTDIINTNVVTKFYPMFEKGWYVHKETLKLTWDVSVGVTDHWIHVRSDISGNCDLYQACHACCGFIHSWCLDCWKVVVRPRSLDETNKLLRSQEDLLKTNDLYPDNLFCKCGPETRPWVFGNWGGYFYNRSKEMGIARCKQIRKLVDEQISPDVPVFLKRYCSEFELARGPSDQYRQPSGAREMEEAMAGTIDAPQQLHISTPGHLKDYQFARWIEFAWDRGDETYMQFRDGEPLVKPSYRYSDGREDDSRIVVPKLDTNKL